MVNVVAEDVAEPWIKSVVGDGCPLPAGLGKFDLVFSNSVIEHVGGHWRRGASPSRSAQPLLATG